jgi:hypothetical protein
VNNLVVLVQKVGKNSIEELGSPDKFLSDNAYLLGESTSFTSEATLDLFPASTRPVCWHLAAGLQLSKALCITSTRKRHGMAAALLSGRR